MDDNYKIRKYNISVVDNNIADQIIKTKNPDCALLYLYLLRSSDEKSRDEICNALGMTSDSFSSAYFTLQKIGAFADEQYLSKEKNPLTVINQARRQNPEFSALCAFYEKSSGKIIKKNEISALYDAYERLKLLPSVIMTLITHLCGTEQGISASKFEHEACHWSDQGVCTIEQAEEYLRESREFSQKIKDIAETLNIANRQLSSGEKEYIKKWISLGFPTETIAFAYEKTILGAHKFSWGYMDRILANWSQKELFSLEQAKGEKFKASASLADKNCSQKGTAAVNEQYINQVKEYLRNKKS